LSLLLMVIKDMKKNEFKKGQALLFVLVAVSVAMVVGVSISNRTLSSVKRTTTSDTYSRVLGAAEGCIERAVVLPLVEVDNLVESGATSSECSQAFGAGSGVVATVDGSACVLPYKAASENLTLQAEAKFETLSNQNPFETTLAEGKMTEVSLEGYTANSVDLCWNNPTTAISVVVYNAANVVRTGYQIGDIGLPTSSFLSTDHSLSGFQCKTVNFSTLGAPTPYGMRLRALYEGSLIRVYPVAPATVMPNQGFRVICKGYLSGSESQSISKEITAVRSNPSMPSVFDYGLYSHEGSVQ